MTIDIVTEVYTDGSSMGNPGKAGYGFVIKYYKWIDNIPKQFIVTGNQGYRLSTNNRMEMLGAIKALEKCLELMGSNELETTRINVYSDSKLLIDAINQNWLPKWKANNWINSSNNKVKNADLWERIYRLIYDFKVKQISLVFNWIKGHVGFEYNELADSLATKAAASNNFIIDDQYENDNKSIVYTNQKRFNRPLRKQF